MTITEPVQIESFDEVEPINLFAPLLGDDDETIRLRFLRIADLIEIHPHRYNQGTFLRDENHEVTTVGSSASPVCGAQHCVAGWATVIAADHLYRQTPIQGEFTYSWEGMKALGLDRDAASVLFSGINPEPSMPVVLRQLAAMDRMERSPSRIMEVIRACWLEHLERHPDAIPYEGGSAEEVADYLSIDEV